MKKWKVTAKDGSVLGVFPAMSQLEAWQQCCKQMLTKKELEDADLKSIAPGVTFSEVKAEDFKPTHIITKNGREILVQRSETLGYSNLEAFFTREEWLEHTSNHWDRVDGKKLRYNGQEQAYASIKEIGS